MNTVRPASAGGGPERAVTPPPGWEVTRLCRSPEVRPLPVTELPRPASLRLPDGRAVIVVNDACRPTPTPWLLERLDVDWSRDDLSVIVAAGSHDPPSEKGLAEILGPHLERIRPRLTVHRIGEGDPVRLGRTSRGTPVVVNRCLEGAQTVICLGSVEPHYFAGWTGGRKSIVPGLCAMETIRHNHRLALEGGVPGRPDECPVHHDLVEGTILVRDWLNRGGKGRLLALNTVSRDGLFYDCFYGPLLEAVDELSPSAAGLFGRSFTGTFPIVVCLVDPPLDRDLYQALKAFENWKSAVAPGGTLILAAGCPEGMGPPAFHQFLSRPPALDELLLRVEHRYRLGDHKLVSFLRYLRSGRSVTLVSRGPLPGRDVPLTVLPDLEEAIGRAAGPFGGTPRRLLLVEDAAHLYPRLP